MKKFLSIFVLLFITSLSLFADNWKNYPVITVPGSNDTFLLANPTNNEQLSASNLWKFVSPFVNIKNFGATNLWLGDSTAAFQTAVNILNTNPIGGTLYIPAGQYSITQPLIFTNPIITIRGDGMGGTYPGIIAASTIYNSTPGQPVIIFSNTVAGTVRDLAINSQNTGTNPLVLCTYPGSQQKMDFDSVFFIGGTIGIRQQNGAAFKVRDCYFLNQSQYCLFIENTENADVGDWSITGNTFNLIGSSPVAEASIYAQSGTVGRIIDNKIYGGTNGIVIAESAGVGTIGIQIIGNNIELQSGAPIKTYSQGGTTTFFRQLIVTGNHFLMSNGSTNFSGEFSGGIGNDTVLSDNVSENGSSPAMFQLINMTNYYVGENISDPPALNYIAVNSGPPIEEVVSKSGIATLTGLSTTNNTQTSINSTGYTNLSGMNQTVINLTGTSITYKQLGGNVSLGTITTPISLPLQPGEAFTGTGCSAAVVINH